MESTIKIDEIVHLRNPTLIGGVFGVGLIANIAATHLFTNLKAKKFGEIKSPFFRDFATSTIDGYVKSPIVEFYQWKSEDESINDIIILFSNSQALTSYGQYELCGKILDTVQRLGCKLIISIEGVKNNTITGAPKVYCTATDVETLDRTLKHGISVFNGTLIGMSGLLQGLAKIREMKGFCILAETTGVSPDVAAARVILDKLSSILGMKIDSSNLEKSAKLLSL